MDRKVIAEQQDILAISGFVVGLRAHDFHEGLRYIVDSRPFRDTNGYWNFKVDDTPDNIQALQKHHYKPTLTGFSFTNPESAQVYQRSQTAYELERMTRFGGVRHETVTRQSQPRHAGGRKLAESTNHLPQV